MQTGKLDGPKTIRRNTFQAALRATLEVPGVSYTIQKGHRGGYIAFPDAVYDGMVEAQQYEHAPELHDA